MLRIGAGETATLTIESLDAHGLIGKLAIEGLVPEVTFESISGAEADALASMSFAGNPLRVYLAFLAMSDGGGDAFMFVALYDDRRVEVRVLRGGASPLYAIFAMTDGGS